MGEKNLFRELGFEVISENGDYLTYYRYGIEVTVVKSTHCVLSVYITFDTFPCDLGGECKREIKVPCSLGRAWEEIQKGMEKYWRLMPLINEFGNNYGEEYYILTEEGYYEVQQYLIENVIGEEYYYSQRDVWEQVRFNLSIIRQ